MYLINLLHFYQPHNQQKDILDRIVHECYGPLTQGMLQLDGYKICVNVSGVLLEQLRQNNYDEVIRNLILLHRRRVIELTGSAMYHAFLPLLPVKEINNQIMLNDTTLKKYFGNDLVTKGFFPPEMAVNDKLFSTVKKIGFDWIFAPHFSIDRKKNSDNCDILYVDKKTGIPVLSRNKRVSSLMLSGVVKSPIELKEEISDLYGKERFVVTVMDAETYGHHRIGHDKFFFDILKSDLFRNISVEDLLEVGFEKRPADIRPCTWTNEEQDFWLDKEHKKMTYANSFVLWKDPTNPIHKKQWRLLRFAMRCVGSYEDKDEARWKRARNMLNIALASDQFWWASAKPWWSLEMLEQGAYSVKMIVKELYGPGSAEYFEAEALYRQILDKAFEWQRSGVIREKHLANSSTYLKAPFKDRAPKEWFNQIVIEFEDQLKKCAQENNFEKAIKWRDALTKIKNGTDIYDVLHVVDELWSARNIPSVKPFLEHSWEEFSDYAREHLLNVSSKDDFEEWKKEKKSGNIKQ